jgi:hypothetical protein
VRIRLDARMERPYERQAFRHELPTWAQEHRADLVWAALVLVQAWVAAGRPPGRVVLGRYESWARIMGGILEVAGIPSFLSNAKEFYEAADLEGAAVRDFVTRWWAKFGSEPTSVGKLFPLTTEEDSLLALEGRDEHAKKTKLGQLLARCRDRRYDLSDGVTVSITKETGKRQGAAAWRLVPPWSGISDLADVTAPETAEPGGPLKGDTPGIAADKVKGTVKIERATPPDVDTGSEAAAVVEATGKVQSDTELNDPPAVDMAEPASRQIGPPHSGPNDIESDPHPGTSSRLDHVDEVEPPW